MMFNEDEIKESSFMRPGDEIISIQEVCLIDKFYKKELTFTETFLPTSSKNEEEPRFLRDGFFPEGLDQQQARFAWTEEDGNIASFVSEPGFGTAGQTSFGKDLEADLASELKEADTSSSTFRESKQDLTFVKKPYTEPHLVSSTSTLGKSTTTASKVDKGDPKYRFHYVKYIKRHGRTIKLWECGICSREFQHQYTLMRHLPTHTDERNFHCNVCGKSFRQLSTLSQHRAIHSAERPYTCEVCNKTFNRVSTLISHRKTHSIEKPYKCHICPKGFHQKGNLRNHLFTHTNARPYRCNICLKGFNQQSNLVCHKNKAHPYESNTTPLRVNKTFSRPTTAADNAADSTNPPNEHCEVSSSVGPYLPPVEVPSPSSQMSKLDRWETPTPFPESFDPWIYNGPWNLMGNGVIVDPIKTYHMGVALATKQTPFALLKPDNEPPVLVKVVDTKIPGGKQMLVPATAEDLRIGGKIVVKNDDNLENQVGNLQIKSDDKGAVQIRVPVVATVVPRIGAGGRLQLCVEEPHHAYHTALSTEGEINVEPCTSKLNHAPGTSKSTTRLESLRRLDGSNSFEDSIKPGHRISSCSLSPPAPSPPLDFISMDLFESMECIPMGPQITAVSSISEPPGSDDSDIFIGKFEESIPLSDSD